METELTNASAPASVDRAAARALEERPPGSPPTPDHAVIWALRFPGEETQLTQVVAQVARADPRFAAAFVGVLLRAAERDGNPANARALLERGLPETCECRAEEHLRDERDAAYGRVDLRFDGNDLTLFVENKLYSGYGRKQLTRYLAALERLPPDRRAGLVAVTRDFPSYGEPAADEHRGWLGSIRWARIREELMRLDVRPPELERQWRLFVEVLDDDGDLGRTKVDKELIRAWVRYLDGREELVDLLEQISARALGIVQASLKRKYPRAGAAGTLASLDRTGAQGQVIARRDQMHVWLGFSVPAIVDYVAFEMQIDGSSGDPELAFVVAPWKADERIQHEEPALARASEKLQDAGYERRRGRWKRGYPSSKFLDADDVPARLLELLQKEFDVIVPSGIFDLDVRQTLDRDRHGPPRLKVVPSYDD